MTTKLERIAKMEAELAALKADVQAESKPKTPCFTPEGGERHSYLCVGLDGAHLQSATSSVCPPKAAFRDQATADAYAEAFNVMLELRLYADGGDWYIWCDSCGTNCYAEYSVTDYSVPGAFSGRYSSREQAELSFKSVGEARIIAAIKTLCGAV